MLLRVHVDFFNNDELNASPPVTICFVNNKDIIVIPPIH